MKSITLVLLISCFTLTCYAQADLKGILRDANSGEAVADAQLSIDNNTTVSSARGEFSFSNIKPGSVQIKISHLSYGDSTVTVTADNNIKIIVLTPKVIELQEVVVNSSKSSAFKLGSIAKKPSIVYFGHVKGDIKVLKVKNDGPGEGLYLKNLNYYFVQSNKTLGKGYHGASFRIKIYDYNDSTGLPGKELTTNPISVTSKGRNKWMSVDLSKFKIPLPANTFFIGIEFTEDRSFETANGMKQIEPCFGGTNEFGQEELCYTLHEKKWEKSAQNIMINVEAVELR